MQQTRIHGSAHNLGQDQARRPNDGTHHNQKGTIGQGKTCNSTGHPRKGVQERNRNRHIRSPHSNGKDVSPVERKNGEDNRMNQRRAYTKCESQGRQCHDA